MSMTKGEQITVFGYTDYRAFLKDSYDLSKKTNKLFSFRYFSKKAGLKAKDHLQKVMLAKRNLSHDTIQKFINGLELKKNEAAYFETLVKYNQAKTDHERNVHFKRLKVLLERRNISTLSIQEYDYFSNWFIPAIRELIPCRSFTDKPSEIAECLMNEVDAKDVAGALELLHKLDLIEVSKNGRLRQKKRHLKVDDDVIKLGLKNYHREMLERAKKAIEKSKSEEREMRAITLGIDSSKLPEAKRMISEFVDELRDFLTESKPNRVYQFNIQLFNLSKEEDDNE